MSGPAQRDGRSSGTLFCRACENRTRGNENLVDFLREHEIVVADSFYAMGSEVDYHFVPDIEPFGMVVHGFGNESDASHVAERRDEILACVFLMQLAVYDFPAG